MAGSLKDQLLKQGLVDKKKLKQAEHAARQQKSGKKKANAGADAATAPETEQQRAAARAALAARAQADRERARGEREAREADERRQRIRQIVDSHKEPKGGDIAHNFTVGTTIKRLWVKKAQHEALARGRLRIVRVGADRFEIVPADTADKLMAIDPDVVMAGSDDDRAARLAAEEAAYADHQIPDDLDW